MAPLRLPIHVSIRRRIIVVSLISMMLALLAVADSESISPNKITSANTDPASSTRFQSRLRSQTTYDQAEKTRSCANFENWIKDYLATSSSASVKARGIELAVTRRAALKDLILSD